MSNVGSPIRRGFSIVELLVVMIIIAMLATIVVPRLIGTQSRQAEIEAHALRALISSAAQRDAMTSGSLAIAYDAEKKEVAIQVLRQVNGENVWLPAQFVRPLRLATIAITASEADGQAYPIDTSWRVEFPPSRPRPQLAIHVQTAPDVIGNKRAWQIDLLPGRTAAVLSASTVDAPISQAVNDAQDLDDEGRRTQPW